ncbi:penicillin-binding transpeptidase domain-containing protein [Streptomyces pathocidini]|uniref:Penicillin-binding transpeptidase domain-containing protein n=2 Tax=Streptomyces pathocidini TaxID=1650571 RepID=A0ABW7UR66_9ACTN
MIRCIRRASVFCLLLLAALLVNTSRIQVFSADDYAHNPANRRLTLTRYAQPRGEIMVGGRSVTGSRDSGEALRYERTYTDGPLFAPVTGYASQTYGTSLLEQTEDDVLSGIDHRLSPIPMWNEFTRKAQPGGRVVTTIKDEAQRAAYAGLGGRRGAVAAIEPSTGRILALASTPSYDPGELSGTGAQVIDAWRALNRDKSEPMLNRALRQTYPPGSAFKVVTAAAVLDAGVLPSIHSGTDTPDPYTLPGTRTRLTNEARGCRDASLLYAFAASCNTVFGHLGADVGLKRMAEAAEGFGFNDPSLHVPSAVAASNFDTSMDKAQVALSSIGQYDTRATPLQMAMVAAAVANDGFVQRPYLVDRLAKSDGSTVAKTDPEPYRQAMSPSTAVQLREMMVAAVEAGTGGRAAIEGVEVGGKTGTAQHGVDNSGTPYAWFISWARKPDAMDPGVAVAVVIEDAEADRADISGGGSAAPIARDVMAAALGLPLNGAE